MSKGVGDSDSIKVRVRSRKATQRKKRHEEARKVWRDPEARFSCFLGTKK